LDALQQLIACNALRDLKARYFYYLDTKDWDRWLALFTPDATLKADWAPSTRGRDGETAVECSGVEEIRRKVAYGTLEPAQTVHHGHTPILEFTSPTTAEGIWAMEDVVLTAEGLSLHGFGHYHETYVKDSAGWRIRALHLTRLRMTLTRG